MHPILFEIWNYPLYLYSLMITLGCVMGIWLVVRYGDQAGLNRLTLLDLCWWLILGGYLGARIIFMIVNWEAHWYPCVDYEYYNTLNSGAQLAEADCWPLIAVWSGGLVFYGAFLGGFIVLMWFSKKYKVRLLPLADALMPAFAIGQFFGRMGCLAAGCCWGKVTDLPWGIEFPRRSMVFRQHVEQHLINGNAEHALAIHPTQIYDSLYGLGLFIVLTWIRRHKRYHGQVFMWWLFLYPLMRSIVELFRGDSERGFITKVVYEPLNGLLGLPTGSVTFLSTSQFISLGVVLCSGIALLVIRAKLNARDTLLANQ